MAIPSIIAKFRAAQDDLFFWQFPIHVETANQNAHQQRLGHLKVIGSSPILSMQEHFCKTARLAQLG